MDDVWKWKIVNRLKSVYRFNTVQDRKESSAEHSWSALMLADYLMEKYGFGLDRLKVFELLLYHDVVEIEAGDEPLHPDRDERDKQEKEMLAARALAKKFPDAIAQRYLDLFEEYEAMETKEAKFAKMVDAFDAEIHEVDYKEDWKGWTREFLIEKKAPLFEEFPPVEELFYELLEHFEREGYFDQ